jgi:hypothetical protein
MHEVSAAGSEYAIVSHRHVQKKLMSRERQEVGKLPPTEGGDHHPPSLPLRARERMSRENLLASCAEGVASTEVGGASPDFNESNVVGDQVPAQAPEQAYQPPSTEQSQHLAYSIVKLDGVSGKMKVSEEVDNHLPLPTSPQPYEVASPTSSTSKLQPFSLLTNSTDPHYEEIQRPTDTGEGWEGDGLPPTQI